MTSEGSRTARAIQSPVALPEEDERRTLVLRIVSSRHLAKAHQLRDILLYLSERAITDPSTTVREHEIGCMVLGRKPDFNAHEDNIVRVQMSHLRKRLADYFAAEGNDEVLRISVPKGAYALRFEPRPLPVPGTAASVRVPARFRRPRIWTVGLFFAVMVSLGAAYIWGRMVTSRASSPTSSGIVRRPEEDLLWPRLFGRQPANVVVADTCLVMLQDILDTDISVAEYLNGQYPESLLRKTPDGNLRRALSLISTRQYTSLADLNSASRLSELSRRYAAPPPAIRYARHINVRDFKTGNFILAGSRRGVPWVRLFESQLNFSMEEDARTRSYYFRNKVPRAGEQTAYRQEIRPDNTVESYADLALVPNLGNTGYVLILSGIGMEAAEGAGEFVVSAEFQKALASILPKRGGRAELRYFEILLRLRAVGGATRNSEVLTYRILPDPVLPE